jgi:4-carboxymuconolactone decarboxylase
MADGDEDGVDAELRHAASSVDPRAVDETVLQSCLFLGFPAALEAAAAWRELRVEPPVEEDPLAVPERAAELKARGERLCRAVYGSAYDQLRANVADASPALDRLMVEVGYGAVLGRPGLDQVRRELCLVAVLAVQDRERQLYSHLRGALRMGAAERWVSEALESGLERAPAASRERLREVWREIRRRRRAGDEDERGTDVH